MRRTKQTPTSLSLSQIVSRIVILAAVLGFFFLLVLLINHWYLHSLIETPPGLPANAAPPPDSAEHPAPLEKPSDREVTLTFYETLNQASSPGTTSLLPTPERQDDSGSNASAPPSPATAPPTSSPTPSASYTVQVGSFRSREGADAIANVLAAQGVASTIAAITTAQGEIWYRVRVGNYSRREDAEKAAQELRQKANVQPFVMSQSPPSAP